MSYHDITVVITTFKSESKIYDCLNSINPSVKIIVIENSNNFKFKEKLETEYPNLKCYLAGENLGYAKGNNLGLSKVKTKFALIINPDARLGDSALENFFKSSKIIPNFAIISPYLQEQNNNSVNYNTYTPPNHTMRHPPNYPTAEPLLESPSYILHPTATTFSLRTISYPLPLAALSHFQNALISTYALYYTTPDRILLPLIP